MLSSKATFPFTFTPPLGRAIRLSSASLAHNAKSTARASLLISCPSTSPSTSSTPLTVSTLSSSHHPSTLLDLYLLGGQQVTLQAKGDGDIHVAGYCTVQDVGEDDDEYEYDEGEGEGYLIDEHQLGGDGEEEEGEEEEEERESGRGQVPGAMKRRAAKTQAVRSIIDELRDAEEEGGAGEEDELDDSDFIGELLEGDEDNEDEEDDDEDEDDEDAEMYEFGEEDDNAASNEELADAIRQQLAGKIRVIETDEEDSEEETGEEDEKEDARKKQRAVKSAAVKEGRAIPLSGKSSTSTAPAVSSLSSQVNGTVVTAAGTKRAAASDKSPAAAASAVKKQKTAAAASSASHTAGSTKTVKCVHCSRMFSTELARQQHAETKHKTT